MRVEILVPTYNQAGFIGETLHSLARLTHPDFTVWVSDDASTDKTPTVLERFQADANFSKRFRFTRRASQSGNLFVHWNEMLRESTAKYVGIFHSDDLYEPEILAQQVALMENDPEVDAVWTGAAIIDAHGVVRGRVTLPSGVVERSGPRLEGRAVYEAVSLGGNSFLVCPSVLYRRSVFDRLGFFDETLKQSSDLEMAFRILASSRKAAFINQPLIRLRHSVAQASFRYERSRKEVSDFFEVLDRYREAFQPSERALRSQIRLKNLDRLHRSILRMASGDLAGRDDMLLLVQPFRNRSEVDPLGGVDRLKVRLAKSILVPFRKTRLAPVLARSILRLTDPRLNPALRQVMRLKLGWAQRSKRT